MNNRYLQAVICGALADFARYLVVTNRYLQPENGVDSFARLRGLPLFEVPAMGWASALNKELPEDGSLAADVLTLAEIFKDTSPGADTQVFDLLHHVVARLHELDNPVMLAPPSYCKHSQSSGHGESKSCGEVYYSGAPWQCEGCLKKDLAQARGVVESLQAQLDKAQADAERFAFISEMTYNHAFCHAVEAHLKPESIAQPSSMEETREFVDLSMRLALEHGLWPLKDGAQ